MDQTQVKYRIVETVRKDGTSSCRIEKRVEVLENYFIFFTRSIFIWVDFDVRRSSYFKTVADAYDYLKLELDRIDNGTIVQTKIHNL